MSNFNLSFLLLPLIAAFIGWLTNYLAVKMLFHPREPVSVLGLKFQGIFPKRQDALAEKLASIVSRELFSSDDLLLGLKKSFSNPDLREKLAPGLTEFITEDLPKHIPILAMMLTPELVDSLKESFMSAFPPLIDRLSEAVPAGSALQAGIEDTVREKVSSFSSDKLEEILFEILRKEFKFIEIVGAVLGLLIGFAQIGLLGVIG